MKRDWAFAATMCMMLFVHREPRKRTTNSREREDHHHDCAHHWILSSWRVSVKMQFVKSSTKLQFKWSNSSYHQKYRLQGHRDFAKELGLNSKLLQTSHVAARLNGWIANARSDRWRKIDNTFSILSFSYLVGVGGVKQFKEEAESLGLSKKQIEYVTKYVEKHEGGGLYCWKRRASLVQRRTNHSKCWTHTHSPFYSKKLMCLQLLHHISAAYF